MPLVLKDGHVYLHLLIVIMANSRLLCLELLGQVLVDERAFQQVVEFHRFALVWRLGVLGPRLEVVQSAQANIRVLHRGPQDEFLEHAGALLRVLGHD